MPPKKKDLAAQKAARDKKILIALVPVFIIIFVVMVLPKLTGGSGGPPPATAAAGTDTTTGVATPVAATVPGAETPGSTPAPAPAAAGAVAAPSYSFTSNEGQLQRLSGKLKTKDPFAGATEVTVAAATVPLVEPPAPKKDPNAAPTPSATGGGSAPTSTTPKAPYIYAVVSVNGLSEGVALKSSFPAANAMFTLTAIGSSWIKFTLVTGSFATGAKEVLLSKGKSVTLRNTADGSRFTVRLIAVSQAVPTATSPTSTNPTDVVAPTTPADQTDTTTTSPPPPTTPAS